MNTSTPWGPSHRQEKVAPGIIRYTTGNHGGYYLSPERLAAMPEYMRQSFAGVGWYEEDCDWCIPVLYFEPEFRAWAAGKPWTTPDDLLEAARRTLERCHPERAARFFGSMREVVAILMFGGRRWSRPPNREPLTRPGVPERPPLSNLHFRAASYPAVVQTTLF